VKTGGTAMKKVKVVDLFNVPYADMGDKVNEVLVNLQGDGKSINNIKVLGDSLNKCAVFIVYEE
jgi:hypothetical protein